MVKVMPLRSGRSGRPVANQFEIMVDSHAYFQSYRTIIARKGPEGLTLDPEWDYSNTTRRYLYAWTGRNRRDILAGIANGSIKIELLND